MQLIRDVEVAPDRAVDEPGDAVVLLVRAYRHAGRRPEAGHAGLSALELVHVLGEGERRLSELAPPSTPSAASGCATRSRGTPRPTCTRRPGS